MKRFILSSIPILGIATTRKHILDACSDRADIILEHLCKCMIYGQLGNDKLFNKYDHWISEIGTCINDINNMFWNTNKKLKREQYDSSLFFELPDTLNEAIAKIHTQYIRDRKSRNPYPEVEVTDKMGLNLFGCSSELREYFSKMLSINNRDRKSDIISDLHYIIDKYI